MNPTLFYAILGVILFLCIYALYNLIGSCEVKPDPKPDLSDEQRKELEQLNGKLEKLEYLVKDRDITISNNFLTIESLKSQLASCERISGIKDTEIKRLKQLKDKPVANLDFTLKKGAKVKGRLLPHGKNYITGIFFEKTKRGKLRLESGQIIDPVDAIEVF